MESTPLRYLKLIAFTILIGLLLTQLDLKEEVKKPGQVDLLEYWAAARLIQTYENPYDASKIEKIQRAEPTTGVTLKSPILMWNPPFVIPIINFLGKLNFDEARIAWLVVTFTTLFLAIFLIFLGNQQRPAISWKPLLALVSFFPIVSILQFGQISWILIFGLAVGLFFLNRHNGLIAGLAISLCLIKPHLLYLTYLSFLIYLPNDKKVKFLLGFMSGAAILGASAELLSPGAWSQWFSAFERPPVYFKTPTVGSLFHRILGVQHGWILYIPAVSTLLILAIFRNKKWCHDLIRDPVTVTALSLATAPYGWIFDQVLMLPLLIRLTMRNDFWIPVAVILINLQGFSPWMPAQDDYWWYPIALFTLAVISNSKRGTQT